MSYFRTPEHRRLRAKLIRQWEPWKQSTGPKTTQGKARVAGNAYKGGQRQLFRELRQMLRDQSQSLVDFGSGR